MPDFQCFEQNETSNAFFSEFLLRKTRVHDTSLSQLLIVGHMRLLTLFLQNAVLSKSYSSFTNNDKNKFKFVNFLQGILKQVTQLVFFLFFLFVCFVLFVCFLFFLIF